MSELTKAITESENKTEIDYDDEFGTRYTFRFVIEKIKTALSFSSVKKIFLTNFCRQQINSLLL